MKKVSKKKALKKISNEELLYRIWTVLNILVDRVFDHVTETSEREYLHQVITDRLLK